MSLTSTSDELNILHPHPENIAPHTVIMGVHSQNELEALLRENIKAFCAKNFQFENELRVSGNISFFADKQDVVTCNVDGTFPPPPVPQTPVKRGRGRPKKAPPPTIPLSVTTRRKRAYANKSNKSKKDASLVNVKSEPAQGEPTVPGEEDNAPDPVNIPVSCPMVAESEAKAESDVPEQFEETEVEDDDGGLDPEFTPPSKKVYYQ